MYVAEVSCSEGTHRNENKALNYITDKLDWDVNWIEMPRVWFNGRLCYYTSGL